MAGKRSSTAIMFTHTIIIIQSRHYNNHTVTHAMFTHTIIIIQSRHHDHESHQAIYSHYNHIVTHAMFTHTIIIQSRFLVSVSLMIKDTEVRSYRTDPVQVRCRFELVSWSVEKLQIRYNVFLPFVFIRITSIF